MKYPLLVLLSVLVSMNAIGQSFCDSILIHSLSYELFHSDSLIEVVVKNESSVFVSYPVFVILDSLGDTVASETVNFFGLGNYYQSHSLTLHQPVPGNTLVNGTLLLTFNNTETVCEWHDDFNLCPDTCSEVRLVMQGDNFPSAAHEYDYVITDTGAAVVASGTMSIDSATYTANDTVCLSPGLYDITWTRVSSSQVESIHFRADALYSYLGPLKHESASEVSLSLDVRTACAAAPPIDTMDTMPPVDPQDSSTLVQSYPANDQFQIGCNEECIVIQNSGANPVTGIQVFDLRGGLIFSTSSSNPRQNIPIREGGVYIVQVRTEQGVQTEKVFKR